MKNLNFYVLLIQIAPTGTALEIADLIKLTKACYKVKCNFLIDEAYYGFYEKTSKILIKKI